MSRETIWEHVRMGWAMLSGRTERDVRPGRPRETPPDPTSDAPALEAEGFADEALPWLDAVYAFAMRLTRGDRDAAEDLTQDTFLRAHRFWHTYERGTNAKSWLFTNFQRAYFEFARRLREREHAPPTLRRRLFRRILEQETAHGERS